MRRGRGARLVSARSRGDPALFTRWLRKLFRIPAEDWLFVTFSPRARVRPSKLQSFFAVPDALDFVDACDIEDLAVLGLDGFEHDAASGSLTPRMELILDCSYIEAPVWGDFRRQANAAARAMLRSAQAAPDLVFEFVLWSEAERASPAAVVTTIEIAPGQPLRMSPKIVKLMPLKGWSPDRLIDTVRNPHRKAATVDRSVRPR